MFAKTDYGLCACNNILMTPLSVRASSRDWFQDIVSYACKHVGIFITLISRMARYMANTSKGLKVAKEDQKANRHDGH